MVLRNTEGGKERADFIYSLLGSTTNTGSVLLGLTKENSRRCKLQGEANEALILGAHVRGVPQSSRQGIFNRLNKYYLS